MGNEKQMPIDKQGRRLSIRAKLVIGFALLSAFISFITARGMYTNLQKVDVLAEIILQQQSQILEQSILVFIIALGLGIFFGYVAGNALTEPIVKLTQGATDFAAGKLDQNIEINSRDEIGDLAKTFNDMASEIRGLIADLEKRVADRTAELENRSLDLELAGENILKRAAQFEAIAQVTQTISSIRNLQKLLPQIASDISKQFGFYHVGVFLIDDAKEYAVLIASNSEGGQKMIARKHRLKIGEQGIVGSATATDEPRIALDVGADAVYFNNPELPDTHSEMALPIRVANQIVGALDVQSTEVGAFAEEDIQTLSLLANQVGQAIENARLFEELTNTLEEIQTITRQSTREAWKRLPEKQGMLGYRYSAMGATPLTEPAKLSEIATSRTKSGDTEPVPFVVPIELRGETIGKLVVQSPAGNRWNEDQQDLIKAVAERVALSAENARLFEETNQRAERERLVSEITGKIRSHNDPQAMINIAINELRSALGASRVEIIPQTAQHNTEGKDFKV